MLLCDRAHRSLTRACNPTSPRMHRQPGPDRLRQPRYPELGIDFNLFASFAAPFAPHTTDETPTPKRHPLPRRLLLVPTANPPSVARRLTFLNLMPCPFHLPTSRLGRVNRANHANRAGCTNCAVGRRSCCTDRLGRTDLARWPDLLHRPQHPKHMYSFI